MKLNPSGPNYEILKTIEEEMNNYELSDDGTIAKLNDDNEDKENEKEAENNKQTEESENTNKNQDINEKEEENSKEHTEENESINGK